MYEVKDTFEWSVGITFFYNALHGGFAYAFHRSQSETDITVMVDRKLQVTLIHIRAERLDTHCLAFVHQLRDIRNVGQTSAHDSRHVFRRVVRFQIGCLISYPRVASSVRFVERIRGKLFPVGPNLFKYFRVMPVLASAFDKLRLHVIQLITQLLTHRLTKGIGLTTGKVRQQT